MRQQHRPHPAAFVRSHRDELHEADFGAALVERKEVVGHAGEVRDSGHRRGPR